MVADVRPAGTTPLPPDAFSVVSGGRRVPARAVPLISDRLAVGLVLDASSDTAAALHAGLSGTTSFVLQLPASARVTAVADRNPPVLVAPLAPARRMR